MSILFDGSGYIQLAQDWIPSDLDNFEVEVEITLSQTTSQRFINSSNSRNTFRLLSSNLYFGFTGVADAAKFFYITAGNPSSGVKTKLRGRVVSGSTFELYKDDVLVDTITPSDFPIVGWFISTIGSATDQPMVDGSTIHSLKLTDLVNASNSSVYNFDDGSGTTLTDSGPLGNHGTLTGFTDLNAAWGVEGPSITTSDDITTEGQTATFTLSGNTGAPTSATLNGTDVGTLTDQGSGVYSFTAPLIADDDTADLVVSVDGTTAGATIAYANSYDRDQLTHPATEAEYSENSLSYPNAYATTQAYEWKVIADANASVVTIDWNALEADDGFHKDVASYATPVANGSTTVTLGVFVPETGQAYQFDRTITVSDGSVVVTGEGLWRELFRDPTEELFTELFR